MFSSQHLSAESTTPHNYEGTAALELHKTVLKLCFVIIEKSQGWYIQDVAGKCLDLCKWLQAYLDLK